MRAAVALGRDRFEITNNLAVAREALAGARRAGDTALIGEILERWTGLGDPDLSGR